MENAYQADVLVGCSTVRPPQGEDAVVTVIARVLPEFRRRGYGAALYENGLTRARALGAGAVETVVLAANTDGVRFAEARGFVETERYVLDGETDLWITMRLR
nr:GNAT family N-acetyltransferase [Streptomyces sp. NBC_00886]